MKFIKCLLVLGLFAVNVSAMDYSVSALYPIIIHARTLD